MEIRKYRILTLLNAAEGKDDQFNEWFTNTHIPDALKIPGFVSGQRFRATMEQRGGVTPQWNYVAIYEIETDNLQGVLDELKRREGTQLMVGTDSIAPGGLVNVFEAITDRMTGA